jgi:hypothetical protein
LPPRSGPASRIEKIAGLLSDLADLMRQADLGKEVQHHLKQLQMRVRFAQDRPAESEADHDAIPSKAPELWRERERTEEDPVSFIRRVYGSALGKGLGRHHLRVLDESLYHSLRRHIRLHGSPPDFDLPKKEEILSREVASAANLSVTLTLDQRKKLSLRKALLRRRQKNKDS